MNKIIYWFLFLISVLILLVNFGIGLMAMSIIIIPVLGLHIYNGINLDKIKDYKIAVLASSVNFLLFVLIRPDGVHSLNENGLSSFLSLFHINFGYNKNLENFSFFTSIILLFTQLFIEIKLRRMVKRSEIIAH
ncbi:hypothetical protein [Marinigracilibium pacificum]|uniref:Uncharacterized protein n=1 Tax=Marinigracilibium pacificum TaxID=2729599 RepID=A0A848IWT7_9BACT|nr:hypothetical protein [Marinigracilibium pacificum]NMM47745.1 hypothetical protein [Marinigracilibium pacificum]